MSNKLLLFNVVFLCTIFLCLCIFIYAPIMPDCSEIKVNKSEVVEKVNDGYFYNFRKHTLNAEE